MKNDNLNIVLTMGGYTVKVLKFACECQTWDTPAHAHSANSYELHYIPRGRGVLRCGGRAYGLSAGVLYTTGPHVEHQQSSDREDPMHEYCLYLQVEQGGGRRGDQPSRVLEPFLARPFWYGPDRMGVEVVLEQIHRELCSPGPAAMELLQALFQQFLVLVLRNYAPDSGAAIAAEPVPLVKAYILIEDSFLFEYDTITLEELARRLGLSTRQTSRVLYSRYGKNFLQMRTEARMAAAADYLREGVLPPEQIAERVGYSCTSHFYAAFKRYYHRTAAQYRAEALGPSA